jgi:transposase-like protein
MARTKKAGPAPGKAKKRGADASGHPKRRTKKTGPKSQYRPEMVETVLALAAEQLVTKVAIAAALRISARTLDTWCGQHEDFEEAVSIATEGVGVGRPPKYTRQFCAEVVALGREGKSRTQMASTLDIARSTLLEWEKQYPEFAIALERADELAQAFFEDQAQAGIFMGNGFNDKIWSMVARNRWPDAFKDATQLNLGVGGAGGGGSINISISSDDANL